MANYDDFTQAVEDAVKDLAKQTLTGLKDEALSDAKAFLATAADDLQRWTKLLAQGDLSQDDFAWLVEGRKDVAELHALKRSGLALVKLDEFRTALIGLVVDTAFDVFL